MNIGSEMNSDRPSIIYKASHYTLGEDIMVIPMTSALREKLSDKFDILVQKDNDNMLYHNSYVRLRQFKSVSKKRIGKKIGEITDSEVIKAIDAGMKEMLGLN